MLLQKLQEPRLYWAVGSGPFCQKCQSCPALSLSSLGWSRPAHTEGGDWLSSSLPKHSPVTSNFTTRQTWCLKHWKKKKKKATHANNEIHETVTDKTKSSKLDLMVHKEVPKVLTANKKQYPPIFSYLHLEWIWQLGVISFCQNKSSVKYFTGTLWILAKISLFVQFIWSTNFHFIRRCYKVRWEKNLLLIFLLVSSFRKIRNLHMG